jgi:hypothetical protein
MEVEMYIVWWLIAGLLADWALRDLFGGDRYRALVNIVLGMG